MSQYPVCPHDWGDLLAICPDCERENLKETVLEFRKAVKEALECWEISDIREALNKVSHL